MYLSELNSVNSISQTPAFPQSTEIFVSFLDSNDFYIFLNI